MKSIRRLTISVLTSLGIFLVLALVLVFSQFPSEPSGTAGLDFTTQIGQANTPLKTTTYRTRDSRQLPLRDYRNDAPDRPLLVLVHGSGWHGAQFDQTARALKDVAEILVPDLRGHGAAPLRRGDVDYIGQLEDDLADLILTHRKPGQKVILAGHSSGGGLVVRFAGGPNRDLIDAAILLAPFLKYNAATTRPNSGGWAAPLTRRIIGLTMLNAVRISVFNHLTAIQFNFPRAVLDGPLGATATQAYSYRMNTAFAPRADYLQDVAQLPPFLLIAGMDDEAFVATAYQPLMETMTDKGRYLLVDDTGHLDIVNTPQTQQAIRAFVENQPE